jgi:hypothetical protein
MSDELFQVEPEEKDTREVAISSNALIERALAHPDAAAMVTVIEKLIAMKNTEEDRQSKISFEDAFARMKAELPTIQKSKEVKRAGGQHMYNYAPLEDIQKVCDPVLRKHGFAYAWREEAIADGKRVWFDLFGHGHTRSNFFDAPLLAAKMSNSGGEIVNAVQAARMTSSYAKRNSMVDGLGLVIEDEDNDASTIELDAEIRAMLEKMDKADTAEKLLDLNKIAVERYRDEKPRLAVVLGCYQINRKRFTGGSQ